MSQVKRVHGTDDCDIVHPGGQVRHDIGNPRSRIAVLSKLVRAPHQCPGGSWIFNFPGNLIEVRFTVPFIELWFWVKQVHLTGSYAYGVEEFDGRKVKTFELAKEIMADDDLRDKLANLVRHSFPLHRYREAIYSAGRSGIKGGVKTVFTVSL